MVTKYIQVNMIDHKKLSYISLHQTYRYNIDKGRLPGVLQAYQCKLHLLLPEETLYPVQYTTKKRQHFRKIQRGEMQPFLLSFLSSHDTRWWLQIPESFAWYRDREDLVPDFSFQRKTIQK